MEITETPLHLISLLVDLKTCDKHKVGKVYEAIGTELMSIDFQETNTTPLGNVIYKRLVLFTIRNFITEKQSQESVVEIDKTIETLKQLKIVIKS